MKLLLQGNVIEIEVKTRIKNKQNEKKKEEKI